MGFLPGNERITCYDFIYGVTLPDLVQKQRGCCVHCELLGEKGDTKCACASVPVRLCVHADVCVYGGLLSHFTWKKHGMDT